MLDEYDVFVKDDYIDAPIIETDPSTPFEELIKNASKDWGKLNV